MDSSHIAFSDESQYNIGRFGSIALLSLEKKGIEDFIKSLQNLAKESEVNEVTWKKVKNAKHRFAATKFIDRTIKEILSRKIRIDILVWDKHDKRHQIQGRDDLANLQRMHYHLLRNVLRKRWQTRAIWELYPDKQSALDWNELSHYLSFRRWSNPQFAWGEKRMTKLREEYNIYKIQQVESSEFPLVQIADLFAGMGTFSFEHFSTLKKWQTAETGQLSLFKENHNFTGSEKEHSRVITHLLQKCKQKELGVTLSIDKKGLYTPKPQNPINFWPYTPQHNKDKAPTKNQIKF